MSEEIPAYGMIRKSKEQLEEKREIVFSEENNPRSLVNLVSNRFREAMMSLPTHYLSMSMYDLERMVDPNEIDRQVRLAFWDEYYISCDNNSKMRMAACYNKTCSREYFYSFIVDDPKRLAYLLKPPEDYMLKMRSLLDVGLRRFEEILKLPVINTKGMVDAKLISELVKIVAIIDNRVKGAVVQRLQVDSKSVNVNYEAPKSYHDVEQELKQISKQLREIEGDSGGGDGEPKLIEAKKA